MSSFSFSPSEQYRHRPSTQRFTSCQCSPRCLKRFAEGVCIHTFLIRSSTSALLRWISKSKPSCTSSKPSWPMELET
eukprot:2752303-Heterocapsa_arctica.AAC.1